MLSLSRSAFSCLYLVFFVILSCLLFASCFVLSCLVPPESSSALSCLPLSCFVLCSLVMSCLVFSGLTLSCLALPCLALPCHALPCLALSCLACDSSSRLIHSRVILSCICTYKHPVNDMKVTGDEVKEMMLAADGNPDTEGETISYEVLICVPLISR